MRLGQLARRIEKRPDQVVEFLAKKKIVVEENPNTKIEDEYVAMVIAHFAPALLEAKEEPIDETPADVNVHTLPGSAAESTPFTPVLEEEPRHQHVESQIIEPISAMQTEPAAQEGEVSPAAVSTGDDVPSEELPAVIKAPKVELKGLKVLGKIELPQPKKKEEVETEQKEEAGNPDEVKTEEPKTSVAPPEDRRAKHTRQKQSSTNRKPNRERKNPIALQREREAREAEEKRLQEIERKKRQRTEYYQKRFQSVPTKKASVINEQVEELHMEQLPEKPKTWWGRFIHWLTTY